jgi:VWFA-related protein
MMRVRPLVIVLCLAAAASPPVLSFVEGPVPGVVEGHAQTQTSPARADRAVQSTATAVLVDVVVRDKRGQPVTDLAAADFEIYEDGVRQEVGSLTAYTTAAAPTSRPPEPAGVPAAPSSSPSKPVIDAPPQPVVALVFDRLSPEARAVANKAALGYVGNAGETQALVGVFGIDLSLVTHQNYTRDSGKLRKAIDGVGTRNHAQGESPGAGARERGQPAAAGGGNPLAVLQAGGQAAAQAAQGGAGAAAADAIAADMQRRTVATFDALEREHQGLSSINALLALVNGMREIPGRKSMVVFSEGFGTAGNARERFRSLVDTANRANVSIYAMDAAGLRTENTSTETKEAINAAAGAMLRRNPTADHMGSAMTQDLEHANEMARNDPHVVLGQLTDETGGILIRNTNDLAGGFKRVDQDMRNYYMLSYMPKNDDFDGKFRTISVKVNRPGVEVAARKGYYAVRGGSPTPIMSFEAPALALLESTPVPNAFPVRAAALNFPERDRPGLTPVLVSVPASALTFRTAEDGASYRAEFTVLVRFRGAADDVLTKMSQNYVLSGPMDKLESVKMGNVLFYREREFEPGVYKMEAIVHDVLGERASVRFATLESRATNGDALRASTLVLVASGERVTGANRPAGNPFLAGDMLLYPNLGEPVRKSASPEIGFFLTVYAAKGPKAEARLELAQNGRTLAALPLPLDQPDSAGRIQQVSRLPTAALTPGTYELRVIVSQGSQQIVRSTVIRLVE